MPDRIPVCFDVLGTCFSFDAAKDALLTVFPDLDERRAASIIDDFFHAGQRDFTYLSMNGNYTPIGQVLQATLPRIYLMHGLVPASSASAIGPDLLEPVLSTLPKMRPRPGLVECSDVLQTSDKFRLMAATNGALATTKQLFENALGNDAAGKWEYFSCDQDKVAKPAPTVYRDVWKQLGVERDADKKGWFVASHTWDLFAAKKAGFRTAFVTYEEFLTLPELFGEPDIVAQDLEDAAKQILAKEGTQV
ncbi:hypothetical protein JCM10212_003667 [Sporobolomyces blumeae]